MFRPALLSLAVAFALASLASAENWPEFRGPTGQGISHATGLPTEWSDRENVVWAADVPGRGWSSPIVHDGRIYLTTAVPLGKEKQSDQSLRALCLDGRSGKELWNVEVFQQKGETIKGHFHSKNSHASPTPATDGRHLFVHFGTHGTACLALDDGQPVWTTQELKYDPQHGGGGSPVLVEDLVVVNCDGADVQFIVALDKATGQIRWKKDRPTFGKSSPFSFSTPLAIEVEGRRQIISPASDKVIAYDTDGQELWHVRYVGYSIVPRPVYANGLVYLSTSFNNPVVYAIRPTGTGDVTKSHVAWTLTRGAPLTPSLLAAGDELYMVSDSGIASCVNGQTGKVHWQQRLGGNYSASPICGDGKLYFQSEDGQTAVVRAGTKYELLARNDIGDRTLASPAVIDSDLLIRTAEKLYRIGTR